METRATGRSKRQTSYEFYKNLFILTIGGGVVFWATTIASFVALVIAIILIDVPRSFLLPGPSDALYYFLIGVMFNVARFLFLGLVIGYLYKRLYGSA